MKYLLKQALSFFLTSGVGWLIDFGGYLFLTLGVGIDVGIANFISAFPAVTFVFFVSTRKIFSENQSALPLWFKYAIYIGYQVVLLILVSYLNHVLFTWLIDFVLSVNSAKILAKLIITPITMCANFIVMKLLIEKL